MTDPGLAGELVERCELCGRPAVLYGLCADCKRELDDELRELPGAPR